MVPPKLLCRSTIASVYDDAARAAASLMPWPRTPSAPNIWLSTSGWSTKAQACGCCVFCRPNSVEKLPGLDLEVCGQRGGQDVRFLQLEGGFARVVDLVHDVDEPLEVRIDGAVERQLFVRYGEAAHVGVVVAALERTDVRFARPAEIHQPAEPDVHVGGGSALWRALRRYRFRAVGTAQRVWRFATHIGLRVGGRGFQQHPVACQRRLRPQGRLRDGDECHQCY